MKKNTQTNIKNTTGAPSAESAVLTQGLGKLIGSKLCMVGSFAVLDDESLASEHDFKTKLGLVIEFDNFEDLREAMKQGVVKFNFRLRPTVADVDG